MCSCQITGILSEIPCVQVFPSDCCCQPRSAKISAGRRQGVMAVPESQACNLLNPVAWEFSCWMNDSSTVKTCNLQRKMESCVCEGLSAGGDDYWTTAWHISEHTTWHGEMESEGVDRGGGGEQWRCDRIRGCLKREETRLPRRFRPHWVFFIYFFYRLHNMCHVCYLRCPAAVSLLGNATAMKRRCDSLCRTCYYSPKASLWSCSLPNELAHKSPSLCSIFSGFVAKRTEGLKQLNLSPVIIGDYEHLDVLLFRITERGGQ